MSPQYVPHSDGQRLRNGLHENSPASHNLPVPGPVGLGGWRRPGVCKGREEEASKERHPREHHRCPTPPLPTWTATGLEGQLQAVFRGPQHHE
ncbi:hypothetical protein J6590_012578 [Homalodisca vitripennis]|nr:hypothetical protein J6590_012578 [Homalodisca vitripennis]